VKAPISSNKMCSGHQRKKVHHHSACKPLKVDALWELIGPTEWSRLNVSLELASVLAWPAEHSQLRNRPHGERRYEHFGCWWFVAEGGVWPHCVVVAPPAVDGDLCLSHRVEDLPAGQHEFTPNCPKLSSALRSTCDVKTIFLRRRPSRKLISKLVG
jgi:hypothetical protein